MIYIQRDTAEVVALTLSQTSQLAEPHFLFEFTNEISGAVSLFHFNDVSGYPERANIFNMTIDLPIGQYTYKVYESVDDNPETVADTTGFVVQTGIMIIHGADDINTDIYL